MTPAPEDVLEFWFGPLPHATRGEWFRKDPGFDSAIRTRFGAAVESALGEAFREWTATPQGSLARVILLDQFTRNIFRGTARAFAGDEQALADAAHAIERGFDRELDRYERWFLYLPFEHAEDWPAQQRSLELFGRLAEDTGDRSPLEWAEKHAEVIRRFGRYPHRNEILGRPSTFEEAAFLAEPGSSF
jgi:uncharacterized protein (DUF924 family)